MTIRWSSSTDPADRSIRTIQAAGTPAPSGADPAAARYTIPTGLPRNLPSHGPSPPVPGSRSQTCAIVRLTKKPAIHDPANHGGIVPRIAPLKRLPGGPATSSRGPITRASPAPKTPGIGIAHLRLRAARRNSTLCAIGSLFPLVSVAPGRRSCRFHPADYRQNRFLLRGRQRPEQGNQPTLAVVSKRTDAREQIERARSLNLSDEA